MYEYKIYIPIFGSDQETVLLCLNTYATVGYRLMFVKRTWYGRRAYYLERWKDKLR
jgi:hypothetical protein